MSISAFLAGMLGEVAAGCPVAQGASLRLMTYNVAFQRHHPQLELPVMGLPLPLVGAEDPAEIFVLSDAERVQAIVDRILQDDPDVLVLNEVNREAPKDLFVLLLTARYPHHVYKVDRPGNLNESGVMLFSKFKIVPVSNLKDGANPSFWGYAQTFSEGVKLEDDGFISTTTVLIYADAVFPDRLANKGAVAVRILNECDGNEPFTVVATHLQASYGDGGVDEGHTGYARQQQFADLKWLVTYTLTREQMLFEPVFVAGDLNVNGNPHSAPDMIEADLDSSIAVEHAYTEWRRTFNAVGASLVADDPHKGFFSCGLGPCTHDQQSNPDGTFFTDSWGFEHPPADVGQTHPGGLAVGGDWTEMKDGEGERLDYVLHNRPVSRRDGSPRICLQYIRRGLDYYDTQTGTGLSDHLPVLADFHRPRLRCSPWPRRPNDPHRGSLEPSSDLGPEPVTWNLDDPSDLNRNFSGNLAPGSMEWYVIDDKLSLRISTFANVQALVYQAKNLSRPIPPFEGECSVSLTWAGRSCKYNLTDPPYFVRVFGAKMDGSEDRAFTGNYTINFHRFNCGNRQNACLLTPGVPTSATWPAQLLSPGALPGEQDVMYFLFFSENARSGKAPNIAFRLRQSFSQSPDLFAATLLDDTTQAQINWAETLPFDPAAPLDPSRGGWSDGGNGSFLQLRKPVPGGLPGTATGDPIVPSLPHPFLLKVFRRSDLSSQVVAEFDMEVTFLSTLTYFQPLSLHCIEEKTWIQDPSDEAQDDIGGLFRPDDGSAPSAQSAIWIGWFNPETHHVFVDGRFFTSFTSQVTPHVWHDVTDGGNYHFWGWAIESGESFIPALEPSVERDTGALQYLYKEDGTTGYHYVLKYKRSHQRPPCRIDENSTALTNYCPAGMLCQDGVCK